jgi:hypothetical protein
MTNVSGLIFYPHVGEVLQSKILVQVSEELETKVIKEHVWILYDWLFDVNEMTIL